MSIALAEIYVFIFEELESVKNIGKIGTEQRLLQATREYSRISGLDDVGYNKLIIERTELGKPYFPFYPQIQVSISHSGFFWGCAIGQSPLGIDIQEHRRQKNENVEDTQERLGRMAHRFFHSLEAEYVKRNCFANFYDVWAAKEAYVKYTGCGIDRNFSNICVIPEERELWSGLYTWQAKGVWFHKIEFTSSYSMCVCAKEKSECIVVRCGAEANIEGL